MQATEIQPGSTIGYLDARTLYPGVYLISVSMDGVLVSSKKVVVE